MITTILTYELKVAILLAVFYMFYRLLLSKETFHMVNRAILLFTAIASFVLPFCVITTTEIATIKAEVKPLILGNFDGSGIVTEIAEATTEYNYQELWQISLLAAMIVGAIIVSIKTIWSIISVSRIIRKGTKKVLADGTEIIVSDKAKSGPFSWMNFIVLSEEDLNEPYKSIILHEQGHIAYGHSWDIIITDLLTSLQWFNPAIWMLRSDLRALHEYQADDYALRGGINAKEYQLLLIKKAISMSGYSVANGFNHSILKNRITMMLSKKSSVRGLVKTLYLIPAVGISLAAFAETKTIYVAAEEEVTNPVTEDKVTENLAIVQEETAPIIEEKVPEAVEQQDGDEEEVFMVVEEMPEFPGGEEALVKYVVESVRYPEEAKNKNIQGRVFVHFVIDKEGRVKDEKVAKEVDPLLDAEAVRVVSAMPKWKPGKHRGQAVNTAFTIPITFALTEGGWKNGEKENASQGPNPNMADWTFVIDGKKGTIEDMKKVDKSQIVLIDVKAEEKTAYVYLKNPNGPTKVGDISTASYPGGYTEMRKYLAENVKYPSEAQKKRLTGTLFVQFRINEDGSLDNVEVIGKDVAQILKDEAVRVVKSMGKFIPATRDGKNVWAYMGIYFKFALQDEHCNLICQDNSTLNATGAEEIIVVATEHMKM
ncbi:MAG: M56 family metallopeptidase [Bacteroidales bacterium]|nr:M56 family metallopeptidase [Bacteroidales bacterium]